MQGSQGSIGPVKAMLCLVLLESEKRKASSLAKGFVDLLNVLFVSDIIFDPVLD